MRLSKIFALLIALNMCGCIISREATSQQGSVSFDVFYNELSPYGQWVDYPGYGYVWIPSVGSDFAPYANAGHWILTDYGWTWVSDYSWGWAPFHYGRWDYDDAYGWFWVPDNEWGPSWVNWRKADGYYGWAPLRPGNSMSISFGSGYSIPQDRWIFVRDRDFSRDDINRYYVNKKNNITIIQNSSVINRTTTDQNRRSTYIGGPDRVDVQRITGRTIQPVVIRDNDKPGHILRNDQLQLYRPQVQTKDDHGRRPAPSRVMNLNDVKRPPQRNAVNPASNINPAAESRPVEQPVLPDKVKPVNDRKQEAPPSRSVNPQNVTQPPHVRDGRPSNKTGKEKQLQIAAPSNKIRKVQPLRSSTEQDEKKKRKKK